jgi:hypothetical protein
MSLLKVWDANRTQRKAVVVPDLTLALVMEKRKFIFDLLLL